MNEKRRSNKLSPGNECTHVVASTSVSASPAPASSTSSVTPSKLRTRPARGLHLSRNPEDLMIPVSVFCKAFPFHFLCDSNLCLLQIGSGKIPFPSSPSASLSLLSCLLLHAFLFLLQEQLL